MRVSTEALAFLLASSSSLSSSNAFGISQQHSSPKQWGTVGSGSSSLLARRHQMSSTSTVAMPLSAASNKSNKARSSNAMQMLVLPSGRDAFTQIIESSETPVRKIPTPIRKAVSVAAIPAAAVGGFFLTPSKRAVAGVVGGAISGLIGGIGKDRLDTATTSAAKPALAQLLLDMGFENNGISDAVKSLQADFNVSDEEFEVICTDLYKQYVVCMCNDPSAKTSDIAELNKLGETLALSNLALGEAHAEAAKDIYRLKATWTPEDELADPEHPDRMSIDKFLFLTERTLRSSGDTEEAFTYEISRVSKAFGLSMKEIQNRVSAIAKPFYLRALSSTRSKLDSGAISSDMLQRARNQLGINDWAARDMHIACFSNEVRSLLGVESEGYDPESVAFPDGALERLDQLKTVLGLADEDAAYEIEHEVTPLFQATASEAFNKAVEDSSNVSDVWNEISTRQRQLGISDNVISNLVGNIAVQIVGGIFEEAVGFAKVNNGSKALGILNKALETKESIVDMLTASGKEDSNIINEKYFDASSQRSATGFIPYGDRLKMYQLYYTQSLKISKGGRELSDEQEENLGKLQTLLGITDATVMETIKNTCGPIVKENMVEACKDILGPEYEDDLVTSLKRENDKLIQSLKVPKALVENYSAMCYADSLKMTASLAPGGIPSKEYVDKLAAIREFLKIDIEDVRQGHLDNFGPAYKRSIIEAMGSTAILRPDFREPLAKLRTGLGVSEAAAETLFLEAVSEKMKPMVEKLVNEMERTLLSTQQLSQKRGLDMGEDVFQSGKPASGKLGIGAAGNLIGDCMSLVDFYLENEIGKVASSDEDAEQTYPITALGMGGCNEESAEQLYRQFLVTCFTEQGPATQRYEAAAPTFGHILGFDKARQEEVGSDIGSMIYENYINNIMRTKTSLDQQDMMFLANIQAKLNLSTEKSQELLVEAQKKNLRAEAANLFADLNSESGRAIKAFRERCNGMGIDLLEDLNVSVDKMKSLFTIEVSEGIENGNITPESAEILVEIQDSFGLSAEDCEEALDELISNCAEGTLRNISNEFRRGRDERAADEIKRLVKYAAFVDGDLELDVSDDMAQRIRGVFDAVDLSEENPEKVKEDKELLLNVLGMAA